MAQLQDLHPAEPEFDEAEGQEAIETELRNYQTNFADLAPEPTAGADVDYYRNIARRLPKFSAPGPSGWTYELIRLGLDSEVSGPCFAKVLAILFQRLWAGQPPAGASMWTTKRLIALTKAAAAGKASSVRPIACADALYRFAMKELLHKAGDVDALLPRWQLGVKVRDGVGSAVHLLRERLEDDYYVLAVDYSNAFNTVSRRCIIKELTRLARTQTPGTKVGDVNHWQYPAARKLLGAVRFAYG